MTDRTKLFRRLGIENHRRLMKKPAAVDPTTGQKDVPYRSADKIGFMVDFTPLEIVNEETPRRSSGFRALCGGGQHMRGSAGIDRFVDRKNFASEKGKPVLRRTSIFLPETDSIP